MLEDAVRSAMDVLAARPSALITDIDGTISPIAPRPEDAVVSDLVRLSLRNLARDLALVAVVTAREETVAREMVGLDELSYVGNYGLAEELDLSPGIERAKARAAQEIAGLPCVQLEDKGVSFALHYRNCEDAGMRQLLLSIAMPLSVEEGAKVLEGKKVIELVPRELPDKGTAIARLAEEHNIRGLVYLGDDLSDIAVFREIARRRSEEGLPGVAIAVVDAETDVAVREMADLELAGVMEVEQLLVYLADSFRKEGTL